MNNNSIHGIFYGTDNIKKILWENMLTQKE